MRRFFLAACFGVLVCIWILFLTAMAKTSMLHGFSESGYSLDSTDYYAAETLKCRGFWLCLLKVLVDDGLERFTQSTSIAIYVVLSSNLIKELREKRQQRSSVGLVGGRAELRAGNENSDVIELTSKDKCEEKDSRFASKVDTRHAVACQLAGSDRVPARLQPNSNRYNQSSNWCDFEINQVHVLAKHHIRCGNLDRAEYIYRRVLEARISMLGPDHPAVTDSLMRIAGVQTLKLSRSSAEKIDCSEEFLAA